MEKMERDRVPDLCVMQRRTRDLWITVLTRAVLLVPLLVGPATVEAGDQGSKTREERQHREGDVLRERAKDEARSQLRYDYLGPQYGQRAYNYFAISQQIARLSALIERLSGRAGVADTSYGTPLPPLVPSQVGSPPLQDYAVFDVTAVYGPQGPTERSVRLLLEYRLMVTGNPRLVVGEVREQGEAILAQIVTVDGSLVEEYAVDRTTGIWSAVR